MPNKTLSVLAASGVLALFALAPVNAQSIPQMEQEQLDDSSKPDVDPGASKGPDAPIYEQEQMQLGNSPDPDVPEGPGADTSGGPTINDQIDQGLEE